MRIKSLLTTASLTFFFLTMPQIARAYRLNQNFSNTANEFAQSTINKASSDPNQSKSPSAPSTEKAKMGMYNAVMSAISKGSGLTTRSREHANQALLLLESPVTDIEFYAKGIAYIQLENYNLAIINFDKAIELNPRRYISYLSRGLAYRDKEKYDRAIADFDRAIELESKMTSTDVEQKDDFNERMEKASGDIHKLIQLDPEPWFYWFRRGALYDARSKAYFRRGDYDRAIADLNTLIQLEPNRAEAYHNRGAAYGAKGDLDRAIADFDRAIQLNPRLKSAHYNRGGAYKLKGDHDRARADFDRETQLYPDTLVHDAEENANDDKQNPTPPATANGELPPLRKSKVDQEIEEAKKRGEVVLTRCLVNCEIQTINGVETVHVLELPKPIYPRIAVAARPSGAVQVQVLIDTDGTVIAASAVDGHPLLWAAAVTAAKGARFLPTTHNGKPVKVTGIILYNFVAR
jgi:TonB family protein